MLRLNLVRNPRIPEPPIGSSRSDTSSAVTTSMRSRAKPASSSSVTTPSIMSGAMAAATLCVGNGLRPGPGAGVLRSWESLSIFTSDVRFPDGITLMVVLVTGFTGFYRRPHPNESGFGDSRPGGQSRNLARAHRSGTRDLGIECLRDERFHARRAPHPQPERSSMRLEGDLEAKERAATTLGGDELQQ